MTWPGQGNSPSARAALRGVLTAAALAGLIFSLHGRALGYGLFLDDHAHFRQLRQCDWSLRGLTDACRLELVGGVIELWWLPDCTLRFFRPAAFALMKLSYALTAWSPGALHAASLGWHLLVCGLLVGLLRRLGLGSWPAAAGAALFAIHPAHVATVQWIAAQTELMATSFLLGALLCYGRCCGWPRGGQGRAQGRRGWLWALGCAALFALALGCRENAIMFPLVVLALEARPGAQRRRRRWLLYASLGLTAAGYLALRGHYLGGVALPPRPYVMPPADPDFARYVFDKACYYLLGEFLFVPVVPIAGLPYFRGRPLLFYGLGLLVLVLLVLLCARRGGRGAGLFAVVWLFGFMLPVLPVFEAPHHLYLPGVGWAAAAGLALREIGGGVAAAGRRVRRARLAAAWAGALLLGLLLGTMTFFFGMALDVAQQVEDRVSDGIVAGRTRLHDGDTLYVANLPLVAHYVKLAVQERTGLAGLRVVALSWSPRLLGLVGTQTPTELSWVDPRTIEVRIARAAYFAGPLGRLVAEANGPRSPLRAPQTLRRRGYRVRVLAGAPGGGVRALGFVFDRVPGRSDVHLFWGSRSCWAMEVFP